MFLVRSKEKKDTKFLKKDLPSTQFFRNWVISCFNTKMSIFVKSSLQKHAFSRNIVRLSHIRKCSDRIIRDFLSGKNKTNKTSYTQEPVFTIRNYGRCYFSLLSREDHIWTWFKSLRGTQPIPDWGSLAQSWKVELAVAGTDTGRAGEEGTVAGRSAWSPWDAFLLEVQRSLSCLGPSPQKLNIKVPISKEQQH